MISIVKPESTVLKLIDDKVLSLTL